MKSFLISVGYWIACCAICVPSLQGIQLHLDLEPQTVSDYKLWMDPSGQTPARSIYSGELDEVFSPADRPNSSLGVTDAVWWIQFDALNAGDEPIDWVLSYPFAMVDFVDFYHVQEGALVAAHLMGDQRLSTVNELLSGEGYAIKLSTPAGTRSRVYVRVHNRLGDALDSYLEVATPSKFQLSQQRIRVFLGFILGGGLIILAYNFVVWLVVRERIYLWYVAYLAAALATFMVASGLRIQLFPWAIGIWSEALPPITSSLTFILLLQFTRLFLETKQAVPLADRCIRLMMLWFCCPPIFFFAGYSSLAAQTVMLGSFALNWLPLLGLYRWRRGFSLGLVFALAWSIWFFAICGMAGRVLGLLPTNAYTIRLGWLGIWAEAVVYALALAWRIRVLRREKSEVEARERVLLENANTQLESQVAERTRELAHKHTELERVNREKDKFFSIIAHDLRNPLSGVVGLTGLLSQDSHTMPPDELNNSLLELHESSSGLHRLLENLLSWAQLQRGVIKLDLRDIPLDAVIQDCVSLFQTSIAQKELHLKTVLPEGMRLMADVQSIELVVRNLLNNAIKYTEAGGCLKLEAKQTADETTICVSDSGVGMSERVLAKLFDLGEKTSEPGTEGEIGSGLGLQLCRELIELHGGQIRAESRIGEGSRFTIYLPNTPG